MFAFILLVTQHYTEFQYWLYLYIHGGGGGGMTSPQQAVPLHYANEPHWNKTRAVAVSLEEVHVSHK